MVAEAVGGIPDDGGEGPVFPDAAWEERSPEEVGLSGAPLDAFRQATGDLTGFVVRHGYAVYSWGDPAAEILWASASKPVHSTMLLFALAEGGITGLGQKLGDFGWALRPDDAGITFRHLANMTSGYGVPEGPGEAWDYNDYAIKLYLETLYDRVFQASSADAAATAPERLGALQFQDGPILDSATWEGWLYTSPRDFARIGWFWLNEGRWDGEQLLPRAYFDAHVRAQVRDDLPRTVGGAVDDYLGVGTFGGYVDQTPHGPGVYGMNLWFNTDQRLWPEAPADAFQANGHWNGEVLTVIPSLGLVVAWRGTAATPETFGADMNGLLENLTTGLTLPDGHGGYTLTGTRNGDALTGFGGDDVVWAYSGDDTVIGEAGDDELYGGHGDDLLLGGLGADRLDGGDGSDRLVGGAGPDVLRGGGGGDLIDGGSGRDAVTYDRSPAAVVVRLFDGTGAGGDAAGDSLVGIEVVHGSAFGDRLNGGAQADRLFGGRGDDTLRGGGGNDFLAGGAGADRIEGGPGRDFLVGGPGPDVFVYRRLSHGGDRIKDFDLGQNDSLDLSELLDFSPGDDLADFVRLSPGAGGTTLAVDPNGGGEFTRLASLAGANLHGPLSPAQLGLSDDSAPPAQPGSWA